jgi:hypothetical protein
MFSLNTNHCVWPTKTVRAVRSYGIKSIRRTLSSLHSYPSTDLVQIFMKKEYTAYTLRLLEIHVRLLHSFSTGTLRYLATWYTVLPYESTALSACCQCHQATKVKIVDGLLLYLCDRSLITITMMVENHIFSVQHLKGNH